MKKEQKSVELWKETIEWIHQTWMQKKGRKYPFMPIDFKHLQRLRKFFRASEVMALWDAYLQESPFFGSKTGYLISGFWQERSVLLESTVFKDRLAMHEKRLGLKAAKDIDIVKKLADEHRLEVA